MKSARVTCPSPRRESLILQSKSDFLQSEGNSTVYSRYVHSGFSHRTCRHLSRDVVLRRLKLEILG